jgi:hypothetical protein
LHRRFIECGEFRCGFADHLAGCYLVGFNFRIVLKTAFTMDYKRFFGTPAAIASVYTDVKTITTPERVSAEEPTGHEMDIAAHTLAPEEAPLHAGLVVSADPPPDIFDKIGAAIGARIVQKSSTSCVYAVPRGRVCELAGKTYAGWVALTTQRHG